MRWLLCLYPRTWRRRYEAEFMALLEERGLILTDVLDIILGALDAHLQHWRSTFWTMREARPGILLGLRTSQIGPVLLAITVAAVAVAAIVYFALGPAGPTTSFWTLLATAAAVAIGLAAATVHIMLGLAGIKLLKEIRDTL